MLTIEEINLAGTILIGLGLMLQGWLEKESPQGIHGLTGMEGNIGLTGQTGKEE